MSAQVQRDDAIVYGKLLQLVAPLTRLPPEPVDENKCPLGMIGRNINRRKPHQRIRRNADFMTIEVEVNVHAGSLHDEAMDVNLGKAVY